MLSNAAILLASSVLASSNGSALIEGVPYVAQKPDFCGEACAEMYLRKLGVNIDQDRVFDRSGLDPSLGRGLWTRELKPTLEGLGFDVGRVFGRVDPAHA